MSLRMIIGLAAGPGPGVRLHSSSPGQPFTQSGEDAGVAPQPGEPLTVEPAAAWTATAFPSATPTATAFADCYG